MAVGIVVVARPGSRRLPLKHLIPIGPSDENIFEILATRLGALNIRATLALPAHCPAYEEWGSRVGWKVWTGSRLPEDEVWQRIYQAAKRDDYNPVIVINGDSPFIGSLLVAEMVRRWQQTGSFVMVRGPAGFHPLLASRGFIKTLHGEGQAGLLTWAIPELIELWPNPLLTKFTLDTRADVKKVRSIFRALGLHATESEIIRNHPELRTKLPSQHPDFDRPPGT